jgi:hypothetical protein
MLSHHSALLGRLLIAGSRCHEGSKGGLVPNGYSDLAAGIAAARERFLAVGETLAGTVRE